MKAFPCGHTVFCHKCSNNSDFQIKAVDGIDCEACKCAYTWWQLKDGTVKELLPEYRKDLWKQQRRKPSPKAVFKMIEDAFVSGSLVMKFGLPAKLLHKLEEMILFLESTKLIVKKSGFEKQILGIDAFLSLIHI